MTVELQGRGIGSQMLSVYCEEFDVVGNAGYLETDKAENVRLCERFGFEVQDEGRCSACRTGSCGGAPTRRALS